MRIAVPAEGPDFAARVSDRLGLSPYLLIVDPESKEFEALQIPRRLERGAGMQVVAAIRKKVFHQPVTETLREIISKTGIEDTFRNGGDEGEERLQNVYELVSLAMKYDHLEPHEAVEQLLEESALQSDQDELGVGRKKL